MPAPLLHLDLCSGLGGFALGLQLAGGFRTIAFAETDGLCCEALKAAFPAVPNLGDINALRPADIPACDIITAGFPCQPVSFAGRRRGKGDDRWLWPPLLAILCAARPRWALLENVAGLVTMGLDDILADLEAADYTCGAFVLPACSVGAPHRRERLFVLAHRDGDGFGEGAAPAGAAAGRQERRDAELRRARGVADADRAGLQGLGRNGAPAGSAAQARYAAPAAAWEDTSLLECADGLQRPIGSGVGLVADGLPGRAAALRALGNAVVPQVVAEIGRAVMAAETAA